MLKMEIKKVDESIIKEVFQPRKRESRKYDFGLLNVVGGSYLYTGSPALNALAALRSGVDLVRVIAPKRAADVIASFKPDLISYPLDCDYISKKQVSEIVALLLSSREVANNKTALNIGGGLGRNPKTKEAVLEIIEKTDDVPFIIDADAIHAIAEDKKVLEGKKFILTPHAYEFYVLTGKSIFNAPLEEKAKAVLEVAREIKGVIVLKGYEDIISDGNEVFVNTTGTPFMTKGGTGDVLAGIVGALVARGCDLLKSALAGTYISGKAGEVASSVKGESLLATDVIDSIEKVININ